MKKFFTSLIMLVLIGSACQNPDAQLISNAGEAIKSVISNPDSYKFERLELMEQTTYAANIKFWENYFRQSYINKAPNDYFEADITAIKESFKAKMNSPSAFKYKIHYKEKVESSAQQKTRVLYFDEFQNQVNGMVYIYGLEAFEFEGLNSLKKYGEIY